MNDYLSRRVNGANSTRTRGSIRRAGRISALALDLRQFLQHLVGRLDDGRVRRVGPLSRDHAGELAREVHRGGLQRSARDGTRTVLARCAQEHAPRGVRRLIRSEEHTSELQSLMRISYAVFCLTKKKTKTNQ